MTQRDPRQQHLEFLQKSLAQVEAELNEAELRVLDLRKNRVYFRGEIARITHTAQNSVSLEDSSKETSSFNEREPAFNPATSNPVTSNEGLTEGETTSTLIDEDEDLEDGDFEAGEEYKNKNLEEEDKRKPKEMFRAGLEGLSLGEAIERAFESLRNPSPSADDIAQALFDVSSLSQKNYFRAKNSLSTELRRGATDKGGNRWKKVGRGKFMSNSAYEQYQSRQKKLASVNGLGLRPHEINNAENLDS